MTVRGPIVPVSRPNRIPPIEMMMDACMYFGGTFMHFESHDGPAEDVDIFGGCRKNTLAKIIPILKSNKAMRKIPRKRDGEIEKEERKSNSKDILISSCQSNHQSLFPQNIENLDTSIDNSQNLPA